MNSLVLSGARRHVLSGASGSCYQAQQSPGKPHQATIRVLRNLSNWEFFEFLSNLKPSERPVYRLAKLRLAR